MTARMRILTLVVLCAIFSALLTGVASKPDRHVPVIDLPEASATCVERAVEKGFNRLVDDDELRAYVRFFIRFYYKDCGRYEVILGAQVGFSPWLKYNSRLNCHDVIFDYGKMNVGPIAGQNPGPVSINCRALGNSAWVELRNTTYGTNRGDRCAGAAVRVVKQHAVDYLTTLGLTCVPS
jgi:hypothetical protein